MAPGARRRGGAPGKLTAAATAWAHAFAGSAATDGALDEAGAAELRSWGVPESEIRAALGAPGDDEDAIDVWPQNWTSLTLLIAAETLWRPVPVVSLAGAALVYPGIDYPGLDVLMRRLDIEDPDGRIWRDIQHMERTALPILNAVQEG